MTRTCSGEALNPIRSDELPLQRAYRWEAERAQEVYMVQPTGGGVVDTYTWSRTLNEARKLATYLTNLGLAPAPIENQLNTSGWIEQSCVMGAGMPSPVAVVMLDETTRAEYANGGRARITKKVDAFREELNGRLEKHERLGHIIIADEEWTIKNELLTPTMKIKRGAIEERYVPMITNDAATA